LVYIDAGCEINDKGEKRFYEYLKMLDESPYDIIGFQTRFPDYTYTTERVFQVLNVSKEDTEIRNSAQIIATVMIMQKGDHLWTFLEKMSQILELDPYVFTDQYNGESKKMNPEFRDARHDQSVVKDETALPKGEQFPIWASRMRQSWAAAPNVVN
jgi:hypothetical protein